MITSLNPLLVYLKLDTLSNGLTIDSSGKGNAAKVQGTPTVLPDDTLGACLSLNGSTDYLTLPPGSIPTGNALTLSFWAYGGDQLPRNCAIIEATDANGLPTLSARVPWGDGTLAFLCGNNGSSNDTLSQALQTTDYKGGWTHWALLKDASVGTMSIYRNGALWLSNTGKTQPIPASTSVRIGATISGSGYYPGKLAQIRIYNQVLSQDEITYTMEADRTALASFRQSFPIDFTLRTGDEEETLPITSDPAGENLYLEIINASAQTLNLTAPSNPTVSASNYHFTLRFRPNTLSPTFLSYLSSAVTKISTGIQPPSLSSTALQGIVLNTTTLLQASLQQLNWSIGYAQEPAGTVALYFLSKAAQQFTPGSTATITLPHASASSVSGTHTTRVELHYQQLTSGNDPTPLSGKRQIRLSVVNQSGQKQIPLHVSFVGYDTILNNGDINTLTLQLTNVLPADPNNPHTNALALNTGTNAPSLFHLSFDIERTSGTKSWALASADQVNAITMALDPKIAASWTVTQVKLSAQVAPEWQLAPTLSKTELGASEIITLTIGNIISTLPSGPTNLYIRYENIPGYWDGQLVVELEKTPLLYRNNFVGIGTQAPSRPLTVRANPAGQELVSFEDSTGTLKWHINQNVGSSSGLNFVETGVADGRLYLKAGGNVGINTTTPRGLLEVKGGNTHVFMTNNQDHTWGLINWTDDNLYFQYLEQGVYKKNALRLDKNGGLFPNNLGTNALTVTGQVTANTLTVTGQVTASSLKIGSVAMSTASSGQFSIVAGASVGINTTNPRGVLDVKGADYHILMTNNQDHAWALINTADDKLYFQYMEQGVYKNNALWLDKNGGLFPTSLSTGQVTASGLIVNGQVTASGLTVNGNFSARNKFFRIDHPARPNHDLLHACLEGPEASVYYRGQAQLIDGRAIISLPTYFEALTRPENRTVLLTPQGEEPFLLSASKVQEGLFTAYGTKLDGAFSWEVKAMRSDVEILEPEVYKAKGE